MVVIPAFNEENHISYTINELSNHISKDQILIANDGSTDNTLKLVHELGVKSVSITRNKGKGFILQKAFQEILSEMPNAKWIITVDADGQHNHEDIPDFISLSRSNPEIGIFIGSRNYSMMPFFNRISNLLTSNWCKFWLRWDIDDLQCGYRCYEVKNLQRILKKGLKCNKFDLETEILLVAWFEDVKVGQIPISTLYDKKRRRSRITPTIDTLRWMRLISRYFIKLTFMRKIWQNR